MQCGEFRQACVDYVQGNCRPDVAQALFSHAQKCPSCAHELETYRALVGALRFGVSARPEFRESLKASLRQEVARDIASRRARNRSWLSLRMLLSHRGLAAAAAIVVVLTVSLTTIVLRHPADSPSQEIAQGPDVRTLLAPEDGMPQVMGGEYGVLNGATRSQAMGFGPQDDGIPATVSVKAKSGLSSGLEAQLTELVKEAGGTIVHMEKGDGGAATVEINIPGDVLDHFMAGLEVIQPVEVSRPLEVTTETVKVLISLNSD